MIDLGQDHKSLFYYTTFCFPENRYNKCVSCVISVHFLSSSGTRRCIIISWVSHCNSYSCSLPPLYLRIGTWTSFGQWNINRSWWEIKLWEMCFFVFVLFHRYCSCIPNPSHFLFFPVLIMVMMAGATLIILQPWGKAKRIRVTSLDVTEPLNQYQWSCISIFIMCEKFLFKVVKSSFLHAGEHNSNKTGERNCGKQNSTMIPHDLYTLV